MRGIGLCCNDTDPEQRLKELMRTPSSAVCRNRRSDHQTDGRRVQLVAEEIHQELRRTRTP